jgi:AraC-like DNA-binding protein
MTLPPAYCVSQEFAPAPAAEFRMDRHYLLYAAKGAMRLEADGRRWSLPPARAALIGAEQPIMVTLPQRMTVCSVLFDPGFTPPAPAKLTVFDMTPLARELILATRGWGPENGPLPDMAIQIFATLAGVAWDLCKTPSRAAMPAPRSAIVARAMDLTEASLNTEPSFGTIARAVGQSPRSLSRRFADDLGMTWRASLRQMRMIRAIEALAATDEGITQVAFSVGYTSLSAFNAAFREFTGRTPSAYRASFRT